jgi:hypothetical protein
VTIIPTIPAATSVTATATKATTVATPTGLVSVVLNDADVALLKGVLELCVVQAPDGGAHLLHGLKLCYTNSLTTVAVDVSEAGLHHLTEVVLQVLPAG